MNLCLRGGVTPLAYFASSLVGAATEAAAEVTTTESVGFAVVGAVVGEYLGVAAGMGYLIQQAEGVLDVAGMFAGMFVLAAFVIVIDAVVSLIEKRLLVWRPAPSEAKP